MASRFNCEAVRNWKDVIKREDIDIVIVSTPPHVHAEISIAAMQAGKHVLCEKPLSKTIEESEAMVKAVMENNVFLKCGFNHRHHPAIFGGKNFRSWRNWKTSILKMYIWYLRKT